MVSPPPDTFYDVLRVNSGATAADLRRAFMAAARRTHPDKGGGEEVFALVHHAYEVLCDPARRREYDLALEAGADMERWTGPIAPLEKVDLDELECSLEDGEYVYWRLCRCGERLELSESDLDKSRDEGEVVLACDTCSLALRILFYKTEDLP